MNNNFTISYCQWTYKKDFEETKLCIERVSPHVDTTIIVYNPQTYPVTDEIDIKNIKWLEENQKKYNLHFILSEFKDNFPDQRNIYLKKAKELNVDWVCVSDPDELFSEELASNLRSLIKKYKSEGYNNLAVSVRDQFSTVECLDKLDLLKEVPGGLNDCNYWKPMLIFKLFDDIRYQGVGIEKNVHETLVTKWLMVTVNLPKEYYYVHRKSSLKIWRNAARNMFMSGGGDNVGSKNYLWIELRNLCSKIGINKWNEFENLVNTGLNKYLDTNPNLENAIIEKDKIKTEFRLWLESALKAQPTKEGTETRECAKWYFSIHKDEIDKRIQDLIDKVPELSEELEVENFVTQMYYKILGRHPDEVGKSNYVKRIRERILKRTDFINELRNSKEHKNRFGNYRSAESFECRNILDPTSNLKYENFNSYNKDKYEKVESFVTKVYKRILGREPDDAGKQHYTNAILDNLIKPSELPLIFRNSDEYVNSKRTSVSGIRTSRKPLKGLAINKLNVKYENVNLSDSKDTLSLCIMGYHSGLSMIKQSVTTMFKYVKEIHIQGDDFTEDDIKELRNIDNRVQIHLEPWIDDFSHYKNKAISHSETEWVIIFDHDEIPTEEMASELSRIISNSDRGNNYDMVSFDVIDIRTLNDKKISETKSKGGKPLLHWNIPNPYIGNPHIWLKEGYYPWKEIHSNVPYMHIKEDGTDLERSVRNIFLGGGGDNSKTKNPNWIKLIQVCDNLNIKTYKDFDNCLRKGKIDDNLLSVIKELSEMEWKDNELKDILKYYYLLHPEEKKD